MAQTDLYKEVNLLRQYSKALQIQNRTRNSERKHLEAELINLRKLIEENGYHRNESLELSQIKEENKRLKDKIQVLQREKLTLQSNYQLISKQLTQQISEATKVVTSSVVRSKNQESQYTTIKYKYENLQRQLGNLKISQKKLIEEKKIVEQTVITLQRQLSQINTQFYSLKIDVERKDNQIQRLRKLNVQNSQIKTIASTVFNKNQNDSFWIQSNAYRQKYEEISRELVQIKQARQKKYNLERNNYQVKINQLETKINSLIKQNNQLKSQIQLKNIQIIQISKYTAAQSNSKIMQFELQNTKKQLNILKINYQNLQRQYHHYQNSSKIHSYTFKESEFKENQIVLLKAQYNKLSLINQSISHQILQLQKDNVVYIQRLKDYQRRISILQETNFNLQKQLRVAIQNRKSLNNNFNEEKLQSQILQLKKQLNQLKQYNSLIYNQNRLFKSKTNRFDDQSSGLKLLTSQPVYLLQQSNESPKANIRRQKQKYQYTQQLARCQSKKGCNYQGIISQKWKNIQRKINFLETENIGLKKTLYYPPRY